MLIDRGASVGDITLDLIVDEMTMFNGHKEF